MRKQVSKDGPPNEGGYPSCTCQRTLSLFAARGKRKILASQIQNYDTCAEQSQHQAHHRSCRRIAQCATKERPQPFSPILPAPHAGHYISNL